MKYKFRKLKFHNNFWKELKQGLINIKLNIQLMKKKIPFKLCHILQRIFKDLKQLLKFKLITY